jgi:hypothetical protein
MEGAGRRRGTLPALAALVVGLAYAAISVYWGFGGTWLVSTVGESLTRASAADLFAVWAAAALKLVAAVLPLLAIGQRLRVLTWIVAVILTGYGFVLTFIGLLVQAGIIKAAPHADHRALEWHAYLWDPWFLVWGLLVSAALLQSRDRNGKVLPI